MKDRFFVHAKGFYKNFSILTLSIALQNLLTHTVSLADNLMLGAYSQDAMSGVSICNQFQFLLQMLVVGVGEGVVVLGTQYWGRKNLKPIPDIIGAALRFGVGFAAVLFALALLAPYQMVGLLSNDPGVTGQAVAYLRIICFTYVLFALTNMLTASLRSIGIVKVGYMITASTLCINIALNSVLIYGRLGFPEMGVRGAAIATLISRVVELLLLIWFLKYREKVLKLNWKRLLHIDTSYVGDYFRVSFPVLLTQAMWGMAQMLQTAILGNMQNSGNVVPANAIAIIVVQIISVIGYGAASGAGILMGKTMGEGDVAQARQNSRTFQIIFLGIGIVTGAIIFLIRDPVLLLYPKLTDEAHALARQMIAVLSVTTVGTCYQMAADNGIIRAGGDTKFPLYNNMVFMFGLCLPMAAISAYLWKLSPIVVFFWLKADQLLKCPVIFWRVHSGKSFKKLTRE